MLVSPVVSPVVQFQVAPGEASGLQVSQWSGGGCDPCEANVEKIQGQDILILGPIAIAYYSL